MTPDPETTDPRRSARELLDFIDRSPTPWHAGAQAAAWLERAGWRALDETGRWTLAAGEGVYLMRGGSALIALRLGTGPLAQHGFRIVAAHTDSPGLRVKPLGAHGRHGYLALNVEVYGSPILATFTDRDLGLAGRVAVRTGSDVQMRLVQFDRAMARLPNVAIHLNRRVNEEGLRLNAQSDGNAVLEVLGSLPPAQRLRALLADAAACAPEHVLDFELALFDAQPGALFGPELVLMASRQLDNLACCHAALTALTRAPQGAASTMVALFDHEEVGSETSRGAASALLGEFIDRVAGALDLDAQDRGRALSRSLLISADMAHARHPSRPDLHDEQHVPVLNGGPVLKINAAQRYITDAATAARFRLLCERAQVPGQHYVHRADLPCGSTVGPYLAARLGVAGMDVGSAMWAMHSARESAGALDPALLARLLTAALTE